MHRSKPIKGREYLRGEGQVNRNTKTRLLHFEDCAHAVDQAFLNGRFLMPRLAALRGRETFIAWYKAKAAEWIPLRVQQLQDRVGIRPDSIEIQDLGFRWGSCTEKGKLFFHWRIILLPPEQIDYLIQHELVHMHEHNHSPAFHERLRRAVPEYERHEEWLRVYGDRYNL